MKKNFPVILLILIIAAAAGGFYFLKGSGGTGNDLMGFREVSLPGSADATTSADAAPTDVPKALSESTPPTTEVTADMRGYQNSAFHFGLLFPKNLIAHQYNEAGGALTATFAGDTTGESFQIYVTPYSDKQITTERFKLDEPSGVYQQPTDILVDRARATMFLSRNGIMGDVREVWFIHGGFLYEVTTYKELDTWLAGIMQTWKFI